MKCYQHQEIEAVKVCKMCHHAYCESCFYVIDDNVCKECVRKYSSIRVRELIEQNNIHMTYGYRLFLAFLVGALAGVVIFYEANQFLKLHDVYLIYGRPIVILTFVLFFAYLTMSIYSGIIWFRQTRRIRKWAIFDIPVIGISMRLLIISATGIFIAIPYGFHHLLDYINNQRSIHNNS